MHRLTVYLTDELYAAIVAHAEAAGQKLSTFVGRELAYLVHDRPPPFTHDELVVLGTRKREARS